jgi:hypothetical protein
MTIAIAINWLEENTAAASMLLTPDEITLVGDENDGTQSRAIVSRSWH